jgi:Bacterial Ig-like domain (group 3)
VRGMIRRGLRLQLVAVTSIALVVPALALAEQNVATQTTLTLDTHDHAGRTTATASVVVTGEDRLPATGSVVISDGGRQLSGAALNKDGEATLSLALPGGDHSLTATYSGDTTHRASVSPSANVQGEDSTTPDFGISISQATLTLVPGNSGNLTVSIAPENASALNAPMFITLSCSGLPDQSSCVFNPENIEILPNATTALTSSMVILTQGASSTSPATASARPRNNGLALAVLLPGALGLGGLAFSMRRRRWLQRLSLLALVALVSVLGTTACNSRYDYYHHGPPPNPPTPAGTYTVSVTAQSSNGVTATTHSATLALTIQ